MRHIGRFFYAFESRKWDNFSGINPRHCDKRQTSCMYLPVFIRVFIHLTSDEYSDICSMLDIMKNTMYIQKYLIQLILLSQKGNFILYNESKIAFCFNKGRFIGPQNQRLGLKIIFFRLRGKRVFSSLGTTMDVRFDREWSGAGLPNINT